MKTDWRMMCVLLAWAGVAAHAQTGTSAAKRKPATSHHAVTGSPKSGSVHKTSESAKGPKKPSKASAHTVKSSKASSHVHQVAPTAESRRLASAFVASAQLRPMAQQLAVTRSPAAFAGVRSYAAGHPGEGSAAAALALGHAEALNRDYSNAENDYRQAALRGSALGDYADYLAAQAAVAGGHPSDAIGLLSGFSQKHPDSIFVAQAPTLLASAYLAGNDAANALKTLSSLDGTPAANHVDVRALKARAFQMSGNSSQAVTLWRGIYLGDPLSPEAANAKAQLAVLNAPLSAAERKQHADALFNAKQYTIAAMEYRQLKQSDATLSQADRDALDIYAAVCDLRLKHLSRADVTHLPVTNDDSAALKLYLESELARNDDAFDEHDTIVRQLEQQFPQSRWLEEALYSGGNMYLVRGDMPRAVAMYTELCSRFPHSTYAPSSHWHAAWLSYRLHQFPQAAMLMDEQIRSYPAGKEIPGALFWRGRMYEDVEHNPAQAANYYRALSAAYIDSYYAMLGRQRLNTLGSQPAADPPAALAAVRPVDDIHLSAELPENDPHLIKARLLANAALNEYIRPELALSDQAGEWSALAEAEIYQSFGENFHALQSMKRSKLPFFSLPVSSVPMPYWQILFPRPYWSQISSNAESNGLDPYLVAALIRQESEFNPGAVSPANAYGLMQLLPSVGKSISKRVGIKHFTTNELLDPSTNIELGTRDLKSTIDRWNGSVEHALASYNAGDTPVRRWISAGGYADTPEWVESIPYTETREYVQAIMRNREMYRAIYGAGH